MTNPLSVQGRDGWCMAAKQSGVSDAAANIRTACGKWVCLPFAVQRKKPTCPDCLKKIASHAARQQMSSAGGLPEMAFQRRISRLLPDAGDGYPLIGRKDVMNAIARLHRMRRCDRDRQREQFLAKVADACLRSWSRKEWLTFDRERKKWGWTSSSHELTGL